MEGFYSKVEHLCQACRVIELAQADEHAAAGRKVSARDDSYDQGFEPNPRFLDATRVLSEAARPEPTPTT